MAVACWSWRKNTSAFQVNSKSKKAVSTQKYIEIFFIYHYSSEICRENSLYRYNHKYHVRNRIKYQASTLWSILKIRRWHWQKQVRLAWLYSVSALENTLSSMCVCVSWWTCLCTLSVTLSLSLSLSLTHKKRAHTANTQYLWILLPPPPPHLSSLFCLSLSCFLYGSLSLSLCPSASMTLSFSLPVCLSLLSHPRGCETSAEDLDMRVSKVKQVIEKIVEISPDCYEVGVRDESRMATLI